MLLTKLNFVHACFLVAGLGAVMAPTHVAAQTPVKATSSPSLKELTTLAAVVKPRPEEDRWQQVPWITDVNEGRRLAREEKRPILLWTILGDPLDEC